MTAYLCDGELVCDGCAVDVTDDNAVIGGETDSPQHCSCCHRPLFDEFGLTTDGVAYVVARVEDALRAGHASNPGFWRWQHGWYLGLDRNACLRDWAELVSDGHYIRQHDKRDERVLRWFLYLSDPDRVSWSPVPAKPAYLNV